MLELGVFKRLKVNKIIFSLSYLTWDDMKDYSRYI